MLKEEIEQFLAEKQIGVVGISRSKEKLSNKVHQKLKESGYDLHPVHPEMESFGGDRCVPSVRQLPSEVQTLMLIASPNVCAQVLKDISETSMKRVWIFSGKKIEPGVETDIERLRDAGVSVIWGQCPFMFLEPIASVHAIHRFFARLFGSYPK